MEQKLSAMKYIKNNKRRVSVLVVSLTLSFVLFYLSQFLLSVTTESFSKILIDSAKKVQYVQLPYYAYGLYGKDLEELGEETFIARKNEKVKEMISKLEGQSKVKKVYYADVNSIELNAIAGTYYVECPMLPKEEIKGFLEHFGAELIEGKMPEKEGEILLDEKYMKNNKFKLGDPHDQDENTEIVGILKSDYYISCGVGGSIEKSINPMCVILTNGTIRDIGKLLHDMGYEFEDKDAKLVDIKHGEKDLQNNIIDAIDSSTNIVFAGIVVVLSLAMLIVYVAYLRDRMNEWCLYCSIGFSRKSIYFAVMRELLFTFGAALLLGVFITAISVVVLDYTMIQSMGLVCRYLHLDMLFEILCVYLLILALLQIPVRVVLYKIRTIDAIDDDLI